MADNRVSVSRRELFDDDELLAEMMMRKMILILTSPWVEADLESLAHLVQATFRVHHPSFPLPRHPASHFGTPWQSPLPAFLLGVLCLLAGDNSVKRTQK